MTSATSPSGARPRKRFLFINRKAPHGTIYAQEALEVVLIAGAFDQDVSLVFMDDGVYQLARNQNTEAIGLKNFARSYRALGDFDVHKIYVDEDSLRARGLGMDNLLTPAVMIGTHELSELMNQQDVVLSF